MAEIEEDKGDARIWLPNIDGCFIPLVDHWNGSEEERNTASREWPFHEKTYEIPLSNKVEEILTLMNDPCVQFDCKYLDFSLLHRRQLRVFLKDTVIQVIRTNFHWTEILSNSLIVFDVSSEMYSAYKNLIMFVCKMMKYPSLDIL